METARITVKEAAKRMGCGEQFVRVSLQRGKFPWGTAEKLSDQWTYYINRAAFEKWLRGETT
jgi:hypothetical protein